MGHQRLDRRRAVVALTIGFTIELLLIIFNVLTSPDPPRWLGRYKHWVWLQQPGDYLMDREILPGGLLVMVAVQGILYSLLAYLVLSMFRRERISTL